MISSLYLANFFWNRISCFSSAVSGLSVILCVGWITKYRYKVLADDIQLRVREIIRQVCAENRVEII